MLLILLLFLLFPCFHSSAQVSGAGREPALIQLPDVTLRGEEFHPHYFDIFLYVLGNIPIGSILRLATGETVLVVDVDNKRGDLPRVRVLKDADGREVGTEIIYDLNERQGKMGERESIIADIFDSPVRDVNVGKYVSTQNR